MLSPTRVPFRYCNYHREGNTPEQTRKIFESLFLHLSIFCENTTTLKMVFCGPNVAAEQDGAEQCFQVTAPGSSASRRTNTITTTNKPKRRFNCEVSNRCTTTASEATPSSTSDGDHELAIILQYKTGLYHDVTSLLDPSPNVVYLFNAGLWGYDDWTPTLEHVLVCPTELSHPDWSLLAAVVVTSYCAEEAEDDMDTLERVLYNNNSDSHRGLVDGALAGGREGQGVCKRVEWLWRPEINPHRSLVQRKSACAVKGRRFFENYTWQAIRPSRYRGRKGG